MKFSKIVSGVLAVSMLLLACQNIDFKKTNAGVPYKIFSSDKGDSARAGTIVKYNVVQKIKDSVVYSSYALKQPIYFEVRPATQKPAYGDAKSNVEEIIAKAKKGDSIYLTQSTDSLAKQNTSIKKGQLLVTTVRIVEVYKNRDEANNAFYKDQIPTRQEIANADKLLKQNFAKFMSDTAMQASLQKDDKIIEDYLKSHNINARKTEWGIYIQDLVPGQGPKPHFKQFANVKYTGMDLNGQTFDSGVFPVQVGAGGAIAGFTFGVMELQKGGKARVYIPSALGYGQQGSPPKIKPNEILIFDLELLDVADMPQQQQQPQTSTGH